MHNKEVNAAYPGDCAGFNVKKVSLTDIKKGYVAGDLTNDPPRAVASFKASIIIIDHPSKIKPGYTPIIDCHSCHIPCKFAEI